MTTLWAKRLDRQAEDRSRKTHSGVSQSEDNMIFRKPQFNLTFRDIEKALTEAGIPLEPANWTPEQRAKADSIMFEAQMLKIKATLEQITSKPIRLTR